MSSIDYALDALLEMDGTIYYYPSGFWLKIEAKRMYISNNYPHAIKYSLTLHDVNGNRVLGYDNAHGVPGKSINTAFDHKHKGTRIISYKYSCAEELLEHFFNDVELILEKAGEYEYEN